MLRFNIATLVKARNIKYHTKFFQKLGFNPSTATNYMQGNINALTLRNVETLCEALNCTPNDMLEFIPSAEQQTQMPAHPLASLVRQNKAGQLMQLLNALPYSKLREAEEILKTLNQ